MEIEDGHRNTDGDTADGNGMGSDQDSPGVLRMGILKTPESLWGGVLTRGWRT